MTEEEKYSIENLMEYIKEDDIYNGKRENLSDFDKFRISHCTDIVVVLEKIKKQQSKLEKKDKIIDLIIKELYKKAHISTKCYLQKSVEECMKYKNCYECLKQYFERKTENEN